MTDSAPDPLAFTPALSSTRHDGWTAAGAESFGRLREVASDGDVP